MCLRRAVIGFAVRSQTGIAPVAGTTGDYNWGGAYGTFFWIDPKEEMAVVYMVAAPGGRAAAYDGAQHGAEVDRRLDGCATGSAAFRWAAWNWGRGD